MEKREWGAGERGWQSREEEKSCQRKLAEVLVALWWTGSQRQKEKRCVKSGGKWRHSHCFFFPFLVFFFWSNFHPPAPLLAIATDRGGVGGKKEVNEVVKESQWAPFTLHTLNKPCNVWEQEWAETRETQAKTPHFPHTDGKVAGPFFCCLCI